MLIDWVMEKLITDFFENWPRNKWLRDGEISVYVRKHIDGKTFTIASIEAFPKGEGNFKRFLKLLAHNLPEKYLYVEIENVINPEFEKHFISNSVWESKRGLDPLIPTYIAERDDFVGRYG